MAVQCDVAFNVEKAAKNEEFLASVSKTYLDNIEAHLLHDIIEHAKSRSNALTENYNLLRIIYAEQDGLLGMHSEISNDLTQLTQSSKYFLIHQ